jgi:hypothetical protein
LKTGPYTLLNSIVCIIAAHRGVENYAASQLIYAIQKNMRNPPGAAEPQPKERGSVTRSSSAEN